MKSTIFLFIICIIGACTCPPKTIFTSTKQAKIYPNPADDSLFVKYNIWQDGIITFRNVNGAQVLQTTIPYGNKTHSIPVKSLPAGLYIYSLRFTATDSSIGKLIIVH